jgi:dynein heavy chain
VGCFELRNRIFALLLKIQDRLINQEDGIWFSNCLADQLEKQFKLQWRDVVSNERLLYCDFIVPGAEPRIYEEVALLNMFYSYKC